MITDVSDRHTDGTNDVSEFGVATIGPGSTTSAILADTANIRFSVSVRE